ncbi:MAG: TraR/DksA family transcriptional regulator [Candidatus Scalindua sp. AMX11]|nr:MAG: TraR/DksA family transcriptional regulator [Candidatus Scalindua sp.]NOG83047.1 TraR/DksA family transcriptional regulator [Planctomycetota bacterium]RZV79554.1 MAG: TraR/DksA family transcriptional regulator [Candidatus Scalindua sp. SCAELEC01]TDE65193.1 MAG: TraR/DksA family transcriptional regulator [Candidatus Scalindua sp. AMX11]GJQ58571.1 MAG: dimethylmenaquinone methyltransferase [Candidatus Scalindua sp.]
MKKHEQIRMKLMKKREEIERRLNKIDQDILHTDGAPNPDSEEQAVERANDDVLDALGGIARSELEDINKALTRIERGEYGNCTVCNKPIPLERLKAIPYTDHCVACADNRTDE